MGGGAARGSRVWQLVARHSVQSAAAKLSYSALQPMTGRLAGWFLLSLVSFGRDAKSDSLELSFF